MAEKLYIVSDDGKARIISIPIDAAMFIVADQDGRLQSLQPLFGTDGSYVLDEFGKIVYF